MNHPRLTRRAALAGLGAAALFPWLRPREARAGDKPRKRLVIWFTPCGTFEKEYRPTGGEKDFTLGKILTPLAPFRDRLLILGPNEPSAADLSNVRKPRGINMPYDGSTAGATGEHANHTLLTGRYPLKQNDQRVGAGISVDQYLAQKLGAGDPFASLQLGVDARNPSASDPLSYVAAGQPLPPENNPAQSFQSIFGGLGAQSATEMQKKARRKEVLRQAHEQAKRLAPTLSGDDRQRIEAHMSGLDTLIQRLDQSFICTPPTLSSTNPKDFNQSDWDNYDRSPQIAAAQIEVLATALACGLTHVATMQFGYPAANTRHPFISAAADPWHHTISHDTLSDGNTKVNQAVADVNVAINVWHMQQLAAFADKLAKIPESDGSSVLDNTLILAVNELSDGAAHTWQNMPFFLLGSAGGALKTGRYLTFESRYHNDLLVSVLNAMGVPDTTFGDPQFCQGPLPGLT